MTLIPDKTLLRLSIYLLSIGYLENGAFFITKVTEHKNIGFYYKVVDNEDNKKDRK